MQIPVCYLFIKPPAGGFVFFSITAALVLTRGCDNAQTKAASLTPARCGVNAGGFFITGRWATAVSCDLTTVIHTHRVPWIQTEAHLLAQARGF